MLSRRPSQDPEGFPTLGSLGLDCSTVSRWRKNLLDFRKFHEELERTIDSAAQTDHA